MDKGSGELRVRLDVAPVRGGTYFSLQRQRKVGKRKPLTPPTPATVHLAPPQIVAPERLSPRTFELSDKGLILPAALRAPKGITESTNLAYARRVSLADLSAAREASSGKYDCLVTMFEGAR
ncbi:hypothetical protein C7402_111138 [Paraburkholderia unamae]|uniref:Uncharacterized protein n=1 Tax=Paraburkholderia unamae TaxID=219649 RepID=A0ABX5KIJ5_9BURK|nr:hypothetical protein C7402_111138 [Paraburkholderia unamae]